MISENLLAGSSRLPARLTVHREVPLITELAPKSVTVSGMNDPPFPCTVITSSASIPQPSVKLQRSVVTSSSGRSHLFPLVAIAI